MRARKSAPSSFVNSAGKLITRCATLEFNDKAHAGRRCTKEGEHGGKCAFGSWSLTLGRPASSVERVGCQERVCTCHDDGAWTYAGSYPEGCSACGCHRA